MLCSSCRKVIRPVIAIDIDGTLADYHTQFIKLAACYTGQPILPFSPEQIYKGGPEGSFREWCKYTFGIDDRTYEDIKLAFRQGGYKRWLQPYEGIDRLMKGLNHGHPPVEVWMTTTRPYMRHDTVDPDTRFWLQLNFVKYDGLIYDEDKYQRLADMVGPERVVAVLDDLPEMYDSAEALFGEAVPILRKTTYNENIDRPTWVDNLESAYDLILGRIYLWEEEHADEVV